MAELLLLSSDKNIILPICPRKNCGNDTTKSTSRLYSVNKTTFFRFCSEKCFAMATNNKSNVDMSTCDNIMFIQCDNTECGCVYTKTRFHVQTYNFCSIICHKKVMNPIRLEEKRLKEQSEQKTNNIQCYGGGPSVC